MCIRDRFTGFKPLSELKNELIAYSTPDLHEFVKNKLKNSNYGDVKNKFSNSIDRWIPVSYTHLDVYKRQALSIRL